MKFALLLFLAAELCRIEVFEKGTDWPVPLVELTTTGKLQWVTDNAGVAAFDAPELMGQEVWLNVRSHGYGVKADGFGMRGVRIVPQPGKTVRIEVERKQLARRIGRLTGSGLFAESAKCGDRAPPESGVVGCDSVQNSVFAGKLHWFWGDTTLAKYPLGIFNSIGATTDVQPFEVRKPPLKPAFEYFRERGKPRGQSLPPTPTLPPKRGEGVRGVADIPGSGPTWLTGVATLPDAAGKERMVATYFKVKGMLDVYAAGQSEWHSEKQVFLPVGERWERSPAEPNKRAFPEGHAVPWTDEQGKPWLLFGDPFPALQMPARHEAWLDRKRWTTLPATPDPVDAASGKPVKVHRGMIAWSAFRKRWQCVFCEIGGKPSHLGEIWHCESPSPLGPWGKATKIATHDNYCFYNPVLRTELLAADPKALHFEGTYTNMFADRAAPTPRWEYNQVLYRLDLDDPRLGPRATP